MRLFTPSRRRRLSISPSAPGAFDRACSHSGSRAGALTNLLLLVICVAPSGAAAQVRIVKGRELPEPVRDLPLVEVALPTHPGHRLALVMSGDGNWARFIRELSDTLADRGLPVVGLESRAWMKHPRTPDELATDMERVLRYYMKAWSMDDFIIVGYSRGADFAPFLANRLPPDLRAKLKGVALFSPTLAASFEFHLEDLVRFVARKTDLPTEPELAKLGDIPVLCVYGNADKDTLCPSLPPGRAEVVEREDGHRLHGSGELADLVLERMGGSATDSPEAPPSGSTRRRPIPSSQGSPRGAVLVRSFPGGEEDGLRRLRYRHSWRRA
jgi:type IV secretory pathway VirJ component